LIFILPVSAALHAVLPPSPLSESLIQLCACDKMSSGGSSMLSTPPDSPGSKVALTEIALLLFLSDIFTTRVEYAAQISNTSNRKCQAPRPPICETSMPTSVTTTTPQHTSIFRCACIEEQESMHEFWRPRARAVQIRGGDSGRRVREGCRRRAACCTTSYTCCECLTSAEQRRFSAFSRRSGNFWRSCQWKADFGIWFVFVCSCIQSKLSREHLEAK